MTHTVLTRLVAAAALLAVALMFALFVVKTVNHQRRRWQGVRRAHYVAAIGEILSRGAIPAKDLESWAADPIFHEVLVEYIGIVAGSEGETLEDLVDSLGLRLHMTRRLRRARTSLARAAAAALLARVATPTEEQVLIEALHDQAAEVRIEAARGLARLGSWQVAVQVLDQMTREQPWVAARLADRLVEFGKKAVPVMVEALGTNDLPHETAILTVRVLGLIGDTSAGPILAALLSSDDPEMRVAAASALGTAGGPDETPVLERALHDPNWPVRARAAASLGKHGSPASVQPLVGAITDDVWWVRQNAAESLAALPGGVAALVDIATGTDAYARDAALLHLGLSGSIRRARDRVDGGTPRPDDDRLLAVVDLAAELEGAS